MWRQVGMIKAHEFIETSAGQWFRVGWSAEEFEEKSAGRRYEGNQNFPKWERGHGGRKKRGKTNIICCVLLNPSGRTQHPAVPSTRARPTRKRGGSKNLGERSAKGKEEAKERYRDSFKNAPMKRCATRWLYRPRRR
jgi:hypothetical protein